MWDYDDGKTIGYVVTLPGILVNERYYEYGLNNIGSVHSRLFTIEEAKEYGLEATKKIILDMEEKNFSLYREDSEKLVDLVSKEINRQHDGNTYKIELDEYYRPTVYWKDMSPYPNGDWIKEDLEWLFFSTTFADSYIETLFKVIEIKADINSWY